MFTTAALLCSTVATAAAPHCTGWPAWEAFKTNFISADGRVIDASTPRQHTVSEGQVYALFFALVANDRETFGRVLEWTENNLADGDLTRKLPAWQWGRRDDGNWGVIDSNPASDADLWLAYALGEAGRLWSHRHWRVLSALVGARILSEEAIEIPGLGYSLLPAPVGFVHGARWRLNPSYAPLMLLRRMAVTQPQQRWQELLMPTRRLLIESAAPHGVAPDWVIWQAKPGFSADPDTQGTGSYDAIRVYLWAGMLHAADPDRAALLAALAPMAQRIAADGTPPEHVDSRSGATRNAGGGGFSAALAPFLDALGMREAAQQQQRRAASLNAAEARFYYAQVLRLFGDGYTQQRYRFAADGRLDPAWTASCATSPRR